MSKQNKCFIKLSYDISEETPCPAGIPGIVTERIYSLEKDGSNVFKVIVTSHSGTHMDAPRHMVKEGMSIVDFDIKEFVYERPCIIDVWLDESQLLTREYLNRYENQISSSDLLIIKTGWWKYRKEDKERYAHKNPGFSTDAAIYLRDRFPDLRAVGMDLISLASAEHLDEGIKAHKILLEGENRAFLIYEDVDLSADLNGLKHVIALPWLIKDFDSSPCTIIGIK